MADDEVGVGVGVGVLVGFGEEVVGVGEGDAVVGDGLAVGLGDVVGMGRPGKSRTSCPRRAAAVNAVQICVG